MFSRSCSFSLPLAPLDRLSVHRGTFVELSERLTCIQMTAFDTYEQLDVQTRFGLVFYVRFLTTTAACAPPNSKDEY